jgi:hypothetical protein
MHAVTRAAAGTALVVFISCVAAVHASYAAPPTARTTEVRALVSRLDRAIAGIDAQIAAVDLSQVFRAEGLASAATRTRVRSDIARLAQLAALRDAVVDHTTEELEAARVRAGALATRAELQDYTETAAALHALSHAERTTLDALRAAIDFAEERLRPNDAIAGKLVFRTDEDLRRWQALQRRLDAAVALENTARANFLGLQHRAGVRVAER